MSNVTGYVLYPITYFKSIVAEEYSRVANSFLWVYQFNKRLLNIVSNHTMMTSAKLFFPACPLILIGINSPPYLSNQAAFLVSWVVLSSATAVVG